MVIKKIMEYRDQNHVIKKDVMNLLMLARNKTTEEESNNAENQDCQQKSNEKSSNISDEGKKLSHLLYRLTLVQ
jgi:hypothetical protein